MSQPRSISRTLAWPVVESASGLVINAASALLIARMIGAEAFGVVSVALGVALLVLVAINSFVHDAMVRMPDLTEADFDTAFSASLAFSILCVVGTGAAGLALGAWLAQPILPLLVASFLPLFPLSAIVTPLLAERRRAMDFSTVAKQQFIGRTLGCLAAVGLSVTGLGLWALSALHVGMAAYLALAMMVIAPRWPRLRLSISRLMPMLSFCAPLILSQFLRQGTSRLFLLAIASWHGFAASGHWSVVMRLSESLVGGINYVIYMVALSKFSRLQEARARLTAAMEQAQAAFVCLALPTFTAIAAAAGPFFVLLLGPSWAPAGALAAGPMAGAYILARQVMPIAALNSLGNSKASMKASATAIMLALVGLLLVGDVSPVAVAVVYPLALFGGYWMIRRALSCEVKAPMGRDLLAIAGDFATAVTAIYVAELAAQAYASSVLTEFLIKGIVSFVVAFLIAVCLRLPILLRAFQITQDPGASDTGTMSALQRWAGRAATARRPGVRPLGDGFEMTALRAESPAGVRGRSVLEVDPCRNS